MNAIELSHQAFLKLGYMAYWGANGGRTGVTEQEARAEYVAVYGMEPEPLFLVGGVYRVPRPLTAAESAAWTAQTQRRIEERYEK